MLRSFFNRFSWRLPRAGSIVALVVALDLVAVVASMAAPRMDVTMDKSAIRAVSGHSFEYTVQQARWLPFFPYYPQGDTLSERLASNLVLREDGALLGPAHSLGQDVADTGMGMYSHWDRNLVFSSSDGTDPQFNTHTYSFTYYPVVDRRLLLALLLANFALLLSRIWRYLHAIPGYLAGRRRRIGAYAVAAIPPVAVSAFLFAYLPPTWNGTDSTGFLMYWPLTFVPHYAILYPLLMDTVRRVFGVSGATVLSVQLLQHFLLIASITYLATVGRRVAPMLVLSIAASIGTTLHLYAHGIYTEGLALPFLIFQVGAFIRIVRFGRWWSPAMVVYSVSLLLEMLTRENFILFGALLPLYGLAGLIAERRALAARLTQILLGAGVCVAVFALGEVALAQYCDRIGRPSTSVFGQQGSYRMVETGSLLSEPDRQRFIERMQAETDDPAVRFAIERMVRNPNPWLATMMEIDASPLMRGRSADEVMNSAFFIYLRKYEPASMTQLMIELHGYFFPMSANGTWMRPVGLYSYLLPYSAESIDYFRKSNAIWSQIGSMGYLDSPLIYRYTELLNNPFVRLLDVISPGLLVVLVCVLVVVGRLLGWARPETGYAAIALVVAAAICALGSALATVTIPRYLAPLNLVLWVGVGLVVADVVGSWVRQAKPAADLANVV